MPENLLTPTGIKIYGRVVNDMFTWLGAQAAAVLAGATAANFAAKVPAPGYPTFGSNLFLQQQLAAADPAKNVPNFARIYAFSHEGHFYDLPKPAIFLVHGPGVAITLGPKTKMRSDVDSSGVVAKEWDFSDDPNLAMWEYDKGDFSLRLDIESGPFEQILLAACLRGGPAFASGSDLRMSGSDLRMSGSDLRMSGSDLRMSGSDLRRR